jgi:hypothetical protein
MKKTSKEANGTSFHDTVIESTVNELEHILGEPDYGDNNGYDKVNFEWVMETDNGDVFTVYDWKEHRSLLGNTVVEWHIGGHSKDVTEQAKREIENARISK